MKHGTSGLQRVPFKQEHVKHNESIIDNSIEDLPTEEGIVKIPRPEGSRQIWGGGSVVDLYAISEMIKVFK